MIKKILVVEDDPQIRINLIDLLELSEYKVFSATNGKEGLKMAEEILPDLIISDIMMPQMDGYEFKQKISSNSKTKSIPFIFLTAKSEMDDFRQGMNLGADDYLVKPVTHNELIKAINVREERLQELTNKVDVKKEKEVVSDKNLYEKQILLDTGVRQEIVKTKEIKVILANGDYTNVISDGRKAIIVRKRLKDWDAALPEDKFMKVHRSTIINIEFITKVEKLDSRSFIIRIKDYEKPIVVSQRNAANLKRKLSL